MKIKVSELQNNIMCIYKITFPNNKIYIGLSNNIKRRMYEHNNAAKASTPCDFAIIKYGKIEEIEIVEIINDYKLLKERERYWIQFYDSFNREKGYNITIGGDASEHVGELNPRAVFTNSQVLDIRKRRFSGERKRDVYKDYSNFSFGTFEKIWLGIGYSNIGSEYIIPTNSISRQEYSSNANKGIKNGRSKLTKNDIIEIRMRYDNGENIKSILNDFNVSLSTMKRVCNRETYKDIN